MKTIYFSNCMATFEGGGVRGAAHAGAYAAAMEAGVRFSRVAGSSAGSVVAALVAAGASPESMKKRMLETDFMELRVPAQSEAAPFRRTKLTGMARCLHFINGKLANALESGGMFSTSALRAWVEKNLREVLAEQGRMVPSRSVRFDDLVLPLYVVATDVLQKEPKVWSRENTPDDSVALAVQASCAIPFYFQPLASGASVLVDGGAISNLPTHVFPVSSGHPGRFSEKRLAFRLRSWPSAPASQFDDAKEYVLGIADTLVTSATHIQQELQDGVYNVEIDTDDIRATDFDRMTPEVRTKLYGNGVQAVRTFIAREREVVGRQRIATQFVGYDERLLLYVHAFTEARSTIWISDSSTYWLWFIFPALASAMRRGVQVRMAAGPANHAQIQEEKRRRNLLRSMGCEVSEQDSVGFTGVLVDYPGDAATAVISSERGAVGQDFPYGVERIKVYTSDEDLPIIRNLGASLAEQVGHASVATSGARPLAIETMPLDEVFAPLKRVRQYHDARFNVGELMLDDSLRVSQTHVKEYKLLQVAKLAEELTTAGFELFAPCRYELADSTTSIITPPVAEMTPQGPVLIEGHTRAFYVAQQGRTRMKVIVVDKVQAPLPVEPRPFADLRIAHGTMEASMNMPGFDKSLIRYIEAAVHA